MGMNTILWDFRSGRNAKIKGERAGRKKGRLLPTYQQLVVAVQVMMQLWWSRVAVKVAARVWNKKKKIIFRN